MEDDGCRWARDEVLQVDLRQQEDGGRGAEEVRITTSKGIIE
jgi:hypothetical protein